MRDQVLLSAMLICCLSRYIFDVMIKWVVLKRAKCQLKNINAQQNSKLNCVGPLSLSPPQMPLQKLLFSATLTQNPEKLQQLGLHQPRLFSSTHSQADGTVAAGQKADRFDFPQGLTVIDEQ